MSLLSVLYNLVSECFRMFQNVFDSQSLEEAHSLQMEQLPVRLSCEAGLNTVSMRGVVQQQTRPLAACQVLISKASVSSSQGISTDQQSGHSFLTQVRQLHHTDVCTISFTGIILTCCTISASSTLTLHPKSTNPDYISS